MGTGVLPASMMQDTATKLPQWVENDRKVRRGPVPFAATVHRCGCALPPRPPTVPWRSPACASPCLQVLRFYGYFKESVVESNMENHRIRKVILYYYLEDDSMHVAEPRQDNSGIPQVRVLLPHRSGLNPPCNP